MSKPTLQANCEKWPISGSFRISRGAKTQAEIIVATISDDTHIGRGECVPYARYGETIDGVKSAIEAMSEFVSNSPSRQALLTAMPAGAARNAIDSALWDYEAKAGQTSVAAIAGITPPKPVTTAYTISLDTPDKMAQAAKNKSHFPLLKLKLGGDGDDERMRAVRNAVPTAKLVVDANEAWRPDNIEQLLTVAAQVNIELIEQPLPADADALLATIAHPVPICADESVHQRQDLDQLVDRYDAVNIKLDKAGGLTEALLMVEDAKRLELKIMVGCMVGTSLAMAPAMLLAQSADWTDLDGPLLLEKDRDPGLKTDGATLYPPEPELWG